MKVKDLLKSLEGYNPEDEIVMKNLYANPLEPDYVMTRIRTYKHKESVVIDGYEKRLVKNGY